MELPMVTIRIQSIDNIICAYLQDLGFDDKSAAAETSGLKKCLPQTSENGDEILTALDDCLYQSAQHIFSDSGLNKSQQIAMLKFCFLRSNGAQKWGTQIFNSAKVDDAMKTALLQNTVQVVPNLIPSRMEPQPIEMPQPAKLIRNIFKHKK